MTLTVGNGSFKENGKYFFTYSGEIHYFRIEEDLWDLHLEKALKAGLNTVSTYIPWCIHEVREGEFDLTGFTRFAGKVREKGLKMIARVGPVSNAELTAEGLPAWLTRNYPQVYLKGRALKNLPHETLVAYNHPDFLKLTGIWYDRVLPEVKKNLLSSGGCISMVQLCNEVGMVHWLNKAADYNPYSEDMYRDFLRERYKDIENLNRDYSAGFGSFEEISQPEEIDIREGDNLIPFLDWMEYYCRYYAEYFGFLYRKAEEHGIDTPIIANIPQFYDFDVRGRGVYSPMTTLMFRKFSDKVPGLVLGGAYQMRRLDYENFHDLLFTGEVMKMVSSPGNPVMCCELQTGIMRDRPRIYPSDVELNLKTSAASGLDALNGYMFSGGKNTGETGAMGSYHEWQAPVSSEGRERPHYGPLKRFGGVVRSLGRGLAGAGKVDDTVFGFYRPYYMTEFLSGPFIDKLENMRTELFFDGFGRTAALAGYSFLFKDISSAGEDLSGIPHIFCFCLEMMDGETQRVLAEYALSGGKLLLYPGLPSKDTGNRPCGVFSELTGISVSRTVNEKFIHMKETEAMVIPPVQVLDPGDNESEVIARTASGLPCALKVRTGKGWVTAAGFGFSHTYDYHVDITRMLLESSGVSPGILTPSSSEVVTLLRGSEEGAYLFALNYHEMPGTLSAEFALPGNGRKVRVPSEGEFTVPGRRAFVIPAGITPGEGVFIEYVTAEVEDLEISEDQLRLRMNGPGLREGVIETSRDISGVEAGSIPVRWEFNRGRLRFELDLGEEAAEVTIRFKG